MTPVKHRSGGRGAKGGFDDQRKERFQPGVRGPEGYVPPWTRAVSFRMTPQSTATPLLTPHASASGFARTAHSNILTMEMNPGG